MTRSVTAEESMCQETAMKLYDLKTGTNTRRVRIFLAEKGVKLSTVEVDMMKGENKNPDYLSKNPMGTMPLLELDDGTQLAESVAICRYIEELHPEPPLFGTTPIERALIEMWNRRMELERLIPIIDNFVHSSAFYRERLSRVADIAHRGRTHAQARMRWLDSELAKRRSSRAIDTRLPTSQRNALLDWARIPRHQFPTTSCAMVQCHTRFTTRLVSVGKRLNLGGSDSSYADRLGTK